MTDFGKIGQKFVALSAVLALAGACTLNAQDTKKKPAPAPAKAAPAPAAKAAPASHPASSSASTATHGTATGGATTASHGATTSGGGVTTANHGATTAGATTANHGAVMTANHGATATSATTAGGTRGGASPAARGVGGEGATGRPGGGPAMAGHGAMAHPGPVGSREVHGPGGDVRMRAGGRPMDVHDARRGMDIHHNLGGGRRVMFDRPGGGHGYYERGRPGYIGHPYMAHGYEFNRRTYYYHGRAYDRFYRPYGYHGYALDVYAPGRYYPVGFYGYAYHPWAAPVSYAWGYRGSPWYGYYGAYFTPYPVYSSPALWLTDYMISQSLEAAYVARSESGAPVGPAYAGPGLSPEVKQMVADEVQREIALENNEAQMNAQQQAPDPASSGIARILTDGQPHVFVAGKEVDVVDSTGQECAVTDGDVLQLTTPPGPNDNTANVMVLSSKGGQECRRNAVVAVGFDDLQDMTNAMREHVDQGLAQLQEGKGGLPALPASAAAKPVDALVAVNLPPPDPKGAEELQQQAQTSEAAEKEVLAQAGGGGDGAAAPAAAAPAAAESVSIAPGQTLEQVKGALGAPTRVVTLGPKTMYFYKDMKVTFLNGKVSNIE